MKNPLRRNIRPICAVLVIVGAVNLILRFHSFSRGLFNNDAFLQQDKSPQGWNLTNEWIMACARNVSLHASRKSKFHPKLNRYQLGDCIKGCKSCDRHYFWRRKNKNLMQEYRQRACPSTNPNFVMGGNLTTVQQLFQERNGTKGFHIPDPDTLVIHLRLGDVIENAKANATTMLLKGADPAHHVNFRGSILSIYEYLKQIRKATNFTRIELMGGAHQRHDSTFKSTIYATCLETALVYSGYSVTKRINGAGPDEDFYYASHAQQIMVSTGGYSRLIGKMVQKNGGKIVGRTW